MRILGLCCDALALCAAALAPFAPLLNWLRG